jgi:hypothetical protein
MLHVEVFDLHNNEDINYAKGSTINRLIYKNKYDQKNLRLKFNQRRISVNQKGSIQECDITK